MEIEMTILISVSLVYVVLIWDVHSKLFVFRQWEEDKHSLPHALWRLQREVCPKAGEAGEAGESGCYE